MSAWFVQLNFDIVLYTSYFGEWSINVYMLLCAIYNLLCNLMYIAYKIIQLIYVYTYRHWDCLRKVYTRRYKYSDITRSVTY